jgi:soluble lytic murein transglycosylase-like protein
VRVRKNVIAVVAALSLGGATMAAVALAAEPLPAEPAPPESKLVERPGQRFLSVIEAQAEHDALSETYRRLAQQAAAVGVEAQSGPADDASTDQLRERVEALRERVRNAADASVVAGVPRDTLEAIASCESGGDPTAVSSDGTYRGKYQFDRGTWASVGGSGDPAAAPEAEQDYRAALLYQRAGSSPWPICGQ